MSTQILTWIRIVPNLIQIWGGESDENLYYVLYMDSPRCYIVLNSKHTTFNTCGTFHQPMGGGWQQRPSNRKSSRMLLGLILQP